MKETLRIGLDLDDCIIKWFDSYKKRFKTDKYSYNLKDNIISRNVFKIKNDKKWWINLPKLRDIDFIPELYCTKRISPKSYSIEWLKLHNFPIRPIYQMVYQKGNKANLIKGRCDIFIDDSIDNFEKCNKSGVFTLLISAPHNIHYNTKYRIEDLNYSTIINKYKELNGFN